SGRELRRVGPIMSSVAKLDFRVEYDGSDLRKPIVLFPNERDAPSFVHPFSYIGDSVSAVGYFYAQHGTIKPEELQGVLIRIREAAVGEYRSDFLEFPTSEGSLIQRWI